MDTPPSDDDERRVRFDGEPFDQPSTAIVKRVATATGRDPTEMPPLYDYVDVEALDALITTGTTRTENRVRLAFTYDGIDVTVDSHEGIEIESDESNRE